MGRHDPLPADKFSATMQCLGIDHDTTVAELQWSLKMKANDSPEAPAFWSWFNHFSASIKTAALRTGLELAVWGKIAEGDCTAEAIATREGWNVDGVRRLLNMLVSMGLLTTEADQYLLVPEAAGILCQENLLTWEIFYST